MFNLSTETAKVREERKSHQWKKTTRARKAQLDVEENSEGAQAQTRNLNILKKLKRWHNMGL